MVWKTCAFVVLLYSPFICANATTWAKDEINDPVAGGKCEVASPASSGSYVYQWPEKYDQVFWPWTDSDGIWHCERSGFITLIGDAELKPGERQRISEYLQTHRADEAKLEMAEKLARLVAIYDLRDLNPDERLRVQRAIAYLYETVSEDQQRANDLRRAALAGIKERLISDSLSSELRLQYLFVGANYEREFGDINEADRLSTQLATLIDASKETKLAEYAKYLGELAIKAKGIRPGGRLAPNEAD